MYDTLPGLASPMGSYLSPEFDLEDLDTHRLSADLWGFNEALTLCVRAGPGLGKGVVLVDEVNEVTATQRLVMIEGLLSKDIWVPHCLSFDKLGKIVGESQGTLLLNGIQPAWPCFVNDGDVLTKGTMALMKPMQVPNEGRPAMAVQTHHTKRRLATMRHVAKLLMTSPGAGGYPQSKDSTCGLALALRFSPKMMPRLS